VEVLQILNRIGKELGEEVHRPARGDAARGDRGLRKI
jgi:hypothetical protein